MKIDHVVLWVEHALDFYVNNLGFEPVREKEFLAGEVRFPSVRVNEETIFDLIDSAKLLPLVQNFTGGKTGGVPISHICLSMDQQNYRSILEKLKVSNVKLTSGGDDAFGAQGLAICSTYFNDPDGNVLEIRYYEN